MERHESFFVYTNVGKSKIFVRHIFSMTVNGTKSQTLLHHRWVWLVDVWEGQIGTQKYH